MTQKFIFLAEETFFYTNGLNVEDQMNFLLDNKVIDMKNYPVIAWPIDADKNENTAFVQYGKRVTAYANKQYYIFGTESRADLEIENTLHKSSTFLGFYNIIDTDQKQIEKLLPNYSFKRLSNYRGNGLTNWGSNDIIYPSAKLANPTDTQIFNPKTKFMRMLSENKKYKDYLTSEHGLFFDPVKKKMPHDIKSCEKTFNEEVLKIKKLVEEIGIPKEIPEYEQINLALYDETNIIEEIICSKA